MATRNPTIKSLSNPAGASVKAKVKPTIVGDAPQHEEAQSFFSDMFGQLNLPSGKRVLVSFIVSMLVGGTAAYLGFQLSMYLTLGAALLTGSAFIAFLVMFLGYALSILGTIVLSGKVQSFILSGDIDRTYESAKNKVTGWLGSARDKASTFTARVSA